MSRFSGELLPGDVMCTRTGGWAGKLIRFGAALMGRSNLVNHVVIVHHIDIGGTVWGIEGKPGGVGWVDVTEAGKSWYTNANTAQPKTWAQRGAIATYAEQLLGTEYDWTAIVQDAMTSLHLDKLWRRSEFKTGKVPAHVVCSSFADWVYEEVGLASPGKADSTRYTTPADWDLFIMEEAWNE